MLVILTGPSGVGKTLLTSRAYDNPHAPDYSLLNYGDVMIDIAKERGWTDNRDELTSLPAAQFDELQEEVPHRIRDKADDELVVLDTHAVLNTTDGWKPGLPEETLDVLEPAHLLYMTAPPKYIKLWSENDTDRDRGGRSIGELREEINVGHRIIQENSLYANCPLTEIKNGPDKLEDITEQFISALNETVGIPI